LESKVRGETTINFDTDRSNNQGLFRLNAGVKMQRGVFPSQVNASAFYGVTLLNGKYNENISNAYISYDYHPETANRLLFENFAFANRFSNLFLGVEERYEVGFGTILAGYSNTLTKNGKKEKDKLEKFRFDSSSFEINGNLWKICEDGICYKPFDVANISNEKKSFLVKSQKNATYILKKMYTTFRVGLLVGVFGEFENIKFTDTIISDQNLPIFETVDVDPVFKVRWEIRPFIEFRLNDEVFFKTKPYLKLPLPWKWNEDVINPQNETPVDLRQDIRIDWESELTFKMGKIKSLPNSDVSLTVSYNLFFDNSPQRKLLVGQLDIDGRPAILSAPGYHRMLRSGLKISF
jgi:hypothetical protein